MLHGDQKLWDSMAFSAGELAEVLYGTQKTNSRQQTCFTVPNKKFGNSTAFFQESQQKCFNIRFWAKLAKCWTVPIFGAFGHQEASHVPKDCGFSSFGTAFLLSGIFWDSTALWLVLLQKCCTVPKFSRLGFADSIHISCTVPKFCG